MAIEIEFEGENMGKALEKACKFFNAELGSIHYKVISEMGKGLEENQENKVKILARRKLETDSDINTDIPLVQGKPNRIVEFLQKVIDQIKLDLKLQCKEDNQKLIINLNGPDKGLLIENKGQLLSSMQYILSKIFSSNRGFPNKIVLDCNGYRKLRERELQEIARKGASIAKRTSREYLLGYMNPYERRVIHITLKSDPSVTTQSKGEGFIKRVAIIPQKERRDRANREA